MRIDKAMEAEEYCRLHYKVVGLYRTNYVYLFGRRKLEIEIFKDVIVCRALGHRGKTRFNLIEERVWK